MSLVKSKSNGNTFPESFNDFFNTEALFPSLFAGNNHFPSVNIKENNKDFQIELAVPGLEKKDFKIEVENSTITISAEKKKEENEEKDNYRRREFSYQSFTRSFSLPDNCQPEKIEARYDNGILTLSLPKKEITPSKPKKEIQVA